MSDDDDESGPTGVSCPECGHRFPIGLRNALTEALGAATDAVGDGNAYVQGYQDAVGYWFPRLAALCLFLGAMGGYALARAIG